MFTIEQLADAVCQSQQKVQAAIYAAGFSPVEYSADGFTSFYGADAAMYLAELFATVEDVAGPPGDAPINTQTVQPPAVVRCQL